jgi:Fe-S cluster biogenesis protein NfuA
VVEAARPPAEVVEAAPPPPAETIEAAPPPPPETIEAPSPADPIIAEAAPPPAVASDPSVVQADEIASHPQAAAFAHYPAEQAAHAEFSSPGSEAPVVLTTPIPHVPERAPSALWTLKQEWQPRIEDWSREHIAKNPRALVIAAPVLAALGIWIAHVVTPHTPRPSAAAREATPLNFTPHPAVAPALSAILTTGIAAVPEPVRAPAEADPAELRQAESQGLPGLEALYRKFPGDGQVGTALASQQAQAQRFDAAIDTIEQLVIENSSAAQNGKVMGILWRAAQSGASERAFACLRKLGGRGTDVIFDLATTNGVRDSVRDRAKAELSSYLAFDASTDTRSATALLLAPDCATRKTLLPRAEREGGKRTLATLERFARGSACTSLTDGACNSCMMGNTALSGVIAKLSAQNGNAKEAAK